MNERRIDWKTEYGLAMSGALIAGLAYGYLGLYGIPFMIIGGFLLAAALALGE